MRNHKQSDLYFSFLFFSSSPPILFERLKISFWPLLLVEIRFSEEYPFLIFPNDKKLKEYKAYLSFEFVIKYLQRKESIS